MNSTPARFTGAERQPAPPASPARGCSRFIVTFTDPQLQQCYQDNWTEAATLPDDLRRVGALIATHDWFQMVEGAHSPRVHETVEHLLLPDFRPGLRRWYQRPDAVMDRVAFVFRAQLSQLAGERFEPAVGTAGKV